MIRRIIIIISVMLLFPPLISSANEGESEYSERLEEYRQDIESSLEGYTDTQTQNTLDEYEITADDPKSVSNISVSEVLFNIYKRFRSALTEPLRMLGKLIAVCTFCVLVSSVTQDSALTKLYETASILVMICVIYDLLYDAISSVSSSLDDMKTFMVGYIPIFSSLLASGANISSAAGYYSVMFVLCEVIAFISSAVLLPLMSLMLSLSIIGSTGLDIDTSSVCQSVGNAVKWLLSALMTIFTGIISIKGIIGSSTDGIASKTARFAASSFIPLVGGAVSEAYSTIYGSLGVIKSGVGVLGIVAVAVVALRPIILIIALKAALSAAGIVSKLFGQNTTAGFLSGINSILSMCLGIITAMSMIFIICTAVILLTSMNTV